MLPQPISLELGNVLAALGILLKILKLERKKPISTSLLQEGNLMVLLPRMIVSDSYS